MIPQIVSSIVSSVPPEEILAITTGFFFVLWLFKGRGRKRERRYYVSKIPSELVIEHDPDA